jgi:hypothetical protein
MHLIMISLVDRNKVKKIRSINMTEFTYVFNLSCTTVVIFYAYSSGQTIWISFEYSKTIITQ